MSNLSSDGKIFGFIPKNDYLKYAYYLLLASGAVGLVSSLLGLVGVGIGLGGLVGLCGLLGLLMALAGFFLLREEFSALEQNHFAYICILFVVGLIAGIVVQAMSFAWILSVLLSLLLSAAMLLLVFTGYNSWMHARMMSKDNIKGEVQLALKRA